MFDTYWTFAARRQELFVRRIKGVAPPWTDDPVLAAHRFTNVYRAADRVSQYLIRNVIYAGDQREEEVVFRTLLFKAFNRIGTWEALLARVGTPSWRAYNFDQYADALSHELGARRSIYSAAYIMPSPPFGEARKHRNHLRLIERMMRDGLVQATSSARSLRALFSALRQYPSIGDFLAFQFAIDINYSQITNFSEMEYVVAGPGARDGIRKCFVDTGGLSDFEIMALMAERADTEFARLGLSFQNLWGRPLQLIDCQNLFCEVGKYARAVHPDYPGVSGRTRIKQRFTPNPAPLLQWYPPKWNITAPLLPADELQCAGGQVTTHHAPAV